MATKIFVAMNATLDAKITSILSQLGKTFDSHEFIKKFIQMYEPEYLNLLVDHANAKNVFKSYHSRIGKYLNRAAKQGLISKKLNADGTPVKSYTENIKGRKTPNHVWVQ